MGNQPILQPVRGRSLLNALRNCPTARRPKKSSIWCSQRRAARQARWAGS